ncbi:MAG: hypothetical protein ABMA02_06575 [Saprospiraceae bacterium]
MQTPRLAIRPPCRGGYGVFKIGKNYKARFVEFSSVDGRFVPNKALMAVLKTSDRVRQLIGENDQRAAADLLMQAFREKNQSLFNIALVQQANIKKLADQIATGILSPDEINLQQAKINAALLHLSDEHARLFEGGAGRGAAVPRWVLWAGAALVLLLLIGWLVNRVTSATTPDTFDLDVYLHEPGGDDKVIKEGEVNLRLGEEIPQDARPLGADGKAFFKNLAQKYGGDSVHLIYFPLKDRRYKMIGQSAAVLSGQDQTILFVLEFVPDTTIFQATLRDSKGRTIAGAQITIDGNIHATSDSTGYFNVAVPKAPGTEVNLVIEKNGKRLFAKDAMITSGHKQIPIE